MSIAEQKITGYEDSISALPDKIENNAAWLKAKFDGRTDKEVKEKHNALIDALMDMAAAASLGAVEGETATTVQAALEDRYRKGETYTRAETDAAIAEKVAEIGAGDMAMAVYDPEGKQLPYLPAAEGLDRATYGGSADGVVAAADKLAAPVKIGDADFDGSAPVTLGQMGALSSAAPAALSPVTPADATYVKNVTGGYAKLGQIVFVSVAGQTAQAIGGGSISVASGLPAPAAALMQGAGFKTVPLPAYGLHCSGGGISAGGSLAITRAPGETYPAGEDFFISGFYYAEA